MITKYKNKYKNVDVILEPHWSARGGCVGWEKVVEQLPCYLSPLRAALHVRRLEYKYKDSQIKLKLGIKINSEIFLDFAGSLSYKIIQLMHQL